LSFLVFMRGWFLLLLASLWIFAYCLSRLAGGARTGRPALRGVIAWGLVLGLCPGTYRALALGQVDPLLWALLGLGLLGIARSVFWGLAALVKIFYLWPLVIWAVQPARRQSVRETARSIWPGVALVAVLVLISVGVCGAGNYVIWARDVLPTLSQGNFNPDNVSLSMAVLRLARSAGWHYAGGPLPQPAHLWLTAASLLAPLVAWALTRRKSMEARCSCAMAAAALFAPACWTSYLPLVLAPLAVWLGERTAAAAAGTTPLSPSAESITSL
jgi:hypothetical protein